MRKTAVSIILVTLLSIFLLGCHQEEGVGTVTAVPQQPTVLSGTNFKLTQPDAQTLMNLRMNPYEMPLTFADEFKVAHIILPKHDTSDLAQVRQQRLLFDDYFILIENDLQQYYPKEIEGSSVYLFEDRDYSGYSSPHLFGRGIIDFLNTYGHSLDVTKEQEFKIVFDPYWYKGRVALKSQPMQLDYDSGLELMLHMSHINATSWTRASAYIPVNITPQNRLEIIPNNFKYESWMCDQVNTMYDLNHDNQNDLLLTCEGYSKYSMVIHHTVFEWGKEGIYRIGETPKMNWKFGEPQPYEIAIEDINSDGLDEIVWRKPCDNHTKNNCGIVDTFSWPQQQGYQENDFPIVSPEACEEMKAAFAQNYHTEQCLRQMRELVSAKTERNINTEITDLINFFPEDDVELRPYHEYLTYLLGYHYELSDDEQNAVATYLDLIQQNPNSPWSWLAWARLEPN